MLFFYSSIALIISIITETAIISAQHMVGSKFKAKVGTIETMHYGLALVGQ